MDLKNRKKNRQAREISVRIVRVEEGKIMPKESIEEIKEEYESEGNVYKITKILSGGSIGLSVGAIIYLTSNFLGAPLSTLEMVFIVGILVVLGIALGYTF